MASKQSTPPQHIGLEEDMDTRGSSSSVPAEQSTSVYFRRRQEHDEEHREEHRELEEDAEGDAVDGFGCFLPWLSEDEVYVPSSPIDPEVDVNVGESQSSNTDFLGLWMVPVLAGFEANIARALKETVSSIPPPDSSHIYIHHHLFLPRRIYIEAPALADITNIMRLSDLETDTIQPQGVSREFLRRDYLVDIPLLDGYVRIQQPGLYDCDLALVVDNLAGDLVVIAVVPRLTQGTKRKQGRTPPTVLGREILNGWGTDEEGLYKLGTRRFHPCGLELLIAPSAHGLITEPSPSEEELALFQTALSLQGGGINNQFAGGLFRKKKLGKEAAVIAGPQKSWQGPLVQINRQFATIHCAGRNPPFIMVPLRDVVLIDEPTHDLAGRILSKPYVARDLTRPPSPRARTPPYPGSEPFVDPFEEGTSGDAPSEGKTSSHFGYGLFLVDPITCRNLEDFHICVGFTASYEGGSWLKRKARTSKPNRFADDEGSCSEGEVCLLWSDNRAQRRCRRVELRYVEPAAPTKKGDQVVIISGDDKGLIGVVQTCKRKSSQAVLLVEGRGVCTYSFSSLCRIERELSI